MEEKFFGNHRSVDPTEVAFVEFLKRVNEKENFVEKTVMQIGYPRWDKTFIKPKNLPNLQQSLTGDSTEHYYIPFVRDSQNFVNAAMIITATPTDTSFSYRVDCDYRLQANSTTSVHDDAEYLAIFFMFMDKRVFGYQKFSIIDSNLFKENGNKATKIELTAAAANPTNGNLWDYVEFCQNVNISLTNCPRDPGQCSGTGGSCDNCPEYCTTIISYTYCWWDWVGTGGGGSGGTTTTGGGGSGGSPTPPNPCNGGGGTTPIPPDDDPPSPVTPCEIAQQAAKRLDTLYTHSKADSVLSTIPNLPTQTVEKGFVIFRKFSVNSQNPTDTTFTGYKTSQVFTGTDSSINFTYNIPYLSVVASFFHTHTANGYAVQSAVDIYLLIESSQTESHIVGNFVAAADGSQYGLTVTDPSLAAAFLATKNQFLNGTKWNEESDIGKAFKKAYDYFENGDTTKTNFAYEMAMAAVLNQYNAGITLNKKDASGNFKPIVVKTAPDPRKPKRTIYTQDCI